MKLQVFAAPHPRDVQKVQGTNRDIECVVFPALWKMAMTSYQHAGLSSIPEVKVDEGSEQEDGDNEKDFAFEDTDLMLAGAAEFFKQ